MGFYLSSTFTYYLIVFNIYSIISTCCFFYALLISAQQEVVKISFRLLVLKVSSLYLHPSHTAVADTTITL